MSVNTHSQYHTVDHEHLDWLGAEGRFVELTAVECSDGRWYLEGSARWWSGESVVCQPQADPFVAATFVNSREAAREKAADLYERRYGVDRCACLARWTEEEGDSEKP